MLQLLNFDGNNNNFNNQLTNSINNIPNTNQPLNLSINQMKSNKMFSAIDFYKPNESKDFNLPKVKIDTKRKLNISMDNIDDINLIPINNLNNIQMDDNDETNNNNSVQPKM